MKRVLLLEYFFPPIGGVGAQRSVKMARYLSEFGWEVTVLTGPIGVGGRWTPIDKALGEDLPKGLVVHRVARPQPGPPGRFRRRTERLFRLQDSFSRWWTAGLIEAAKDIPGRFDVIHASMAPYETAEAAACIAEMRSIPWVADLQDPWALDEMTVYPSGLHRSGERDRMRFALARADAVVMNAPEAGKLVTRWMPEVTRGRFAVIPNGYDAADFSGDAPQRTDGRFRVVHTGSLHTALGRRHDLRRRVDRIMRGGAYRVDILARSHVHLVSAVNRIVERQPEIADRLELHLAGVMTDADRRVAEQCLAPVTMPGYLDHDQSVDLLRGADLLFLPMHGLRDGTRASIVPAKTYEYIGSGRPILAAVPPGDARDLLREAGSAVICDPADVDALEVELQRALDRWGAGDTLMPPPNPDVLARLEYRRLAEQMAGVLDSVVTAA